MIQDMCIRVDSRDNICGYASKKECHRFVPQQPEGQLHRAFSVFLFNSKNELLLQQRASSKVTFPGVRSKTSGAPSVQRNQAQMQSGSDSCNLP